MKEKIQALYKSVMPYINSNGKNTTPVSYIDVYRYTQKEMILPDIPNSYLFFVVHGNMRLHSIDGIFECKSGQYFISAIDSPRTAEILSDLQTYPFIALLIEFSVDDVISVMLDIDGDLPEKLFDEAVTVAIPPCTDKKMTEILIRLLSMTPTELSFMGKHLKREIIFNIITGAYGKQFMQHIVNIQQAGISCNLRFLLIQGAHPLSCFVGCNAQSKFLQVQNLLKLFMLQSSTFQLMKKGTIQTPDCAFSISITIGQFNFPYAIQRGSGFLPPSFFHRLLAPVPKERPQS